MPQSGDDGINDDLDSAAISREEFVLTMLRKLGMVSDVMLETLYTQFMAIDNDNSGFITKDDMNKQYERVVKLRRASLQMAAIGAGS